MAKEKKKGGRFSRLVTFILVVVVFSSFVNFLNKQNNENKNQSAATTSNPAPDYVSMSIEDALEAAITQAEKQSSGVTTRSIDASDEDVVMVEAFIEPFSIQSGLNNTVKYAIDLFDCAFQQKDVPSIYIRFFQGRVDEYGNNAEGVPITMRLTRKTAEKINFDYFRKYSYTQQKNFLEALDGYSLEKEYKKVLEQE